VPQSYGSRELIDRLIAFPTVSADSNLDLIEFTRDYLAGWGMDIRLTRDATGKKANLFATLPGSGGEREGGLVLSGHTDVVPVVGQAWDTDPFRVTEKDGRLYGRGTCDMKSFIAISMAMVPEIVAKKLPYPVHFAFSYDEEVGCLGAAHMIRDLVDAGIRPRFAVIGEPTLMQVVNAHKGCACYQTHVKGVAVHSSQPHRGASAVFTAARIITAIEEEAKRAKARARPGYDFDPPYTTINCNMVEGGTAFNIIPSAATLSWEFRLAPWDEAAPITASIQNYIETVALPALRAEHPDGDIWTEAICAIPPLKPDARSVLEPLALAVTGNNRAMQVAYGAEAGLFQEAGIDTIICGPGSINQAHQPNEWIDIDQIGQCEEFLRKLTDRLVV
jgi:acetylornithine deacetylase